jgi:ankyrin repeat protein
MYDETAVCQLADILLDAGAVPDPKSTTESPLIVVASNENKMSLKNQIWLLDLLLSYGADVNRQTMNQGNTALIYAIALNTTHYVMDTINWLLDHGADVNLTNSTQSTALMMAVVQPKINLDTVRRLLRVPGINLDHTNAHGDSALTLAILSGDQPTGTEIARELIRAGAAVEHELYRTKTIGESVLRLAYETVTEDLTRVRSMRAILTADDVVLSVVLQYL